MLLVLQTAEDCHVSVSGVVLNLCGLKIKYVLEFEESKEIWEFNI